MRVSPLELERMKALAKSRHCKSVAEMIRALFRDEANHKKFVRGLAKPDGRPLHESKVLRP